MDAKPYSPNPLANHYDITFIDQGCCFNAEHWTFPDISLTGTYHRNFVYEHVTGWDAFEPVLSRAEQMDSQELWKLAQGMPEEWWNREPWEKIQWSGAPKPKEWWEKKLLNMMWVQWAKIIQNIPIAQRSAETNAANAMEAL